MQFVAIVLLSVAAAVVYGIAHDQVTVRVCLEYFTVGHPPVFNTTSPTLLALGWGVIATWWVGLPLGLTLATAALIGRRPKFGVRSLVRPVGVLLLVMSASALACGLIGYALASRSSISLWEPLASRVPRSAHVRFLADLWAHNASYFVGFFGGLVLAGWVWRRRQAVVAA